MRIIYFQYWEFFSEKNVGLRGFLRINFDDKNMTLLKKTYKKTP